MAHAPFTRFRPSHPPHPGARVIEAIPRAGEPRRIVDHPAGVDPGESAASPGALIRRRLQHPGRFPHEAYIEQF